MDKKRCFVCIVMCIIFTTIFGKTKVDAKTGYFGFWENELQYGEDSYTAYIEIEKGVKFNIAEWAYIEDGDAEEVCTERQYKKLKFSNSNKKVASVSATGWVTTKKTGKTTIQIKKGKMNIICHLKVVKKKKVTKLVKDSAMMNKKINTAIAIYDGAVSKENYLQLLDAVLEAESVIKKNDKNTKVVKKKASDKYVKMILPNYYAYEDVRWALSAYMQGERAELFQSPLPTVKEVQFSGKTGQAVLSRPLEKREVIALNMEDVADMHITYKSPAYNRLKKDKLEGTFKIWFSGTDKLTGMMVTHEIIVHCQAGTENAVLTSDVVITPGVYCVMQSSTGIENQFYVEVK